MMKILWYASLISLTASVSCLVWLGWQYYKAMHNLIWKDEYFVEG